MLQQSTPDPERSFGGADVSDQGLGWLDDIAVAEGDSRRAFNNLV